MKSLLESPVWMFYCSLIIIASILICLAILYWIRKKIHYKRLKKNHDVVGFTFSIVGVLYSVILGFTVINVQNRYNALLECIHSEAILLADLYQDAAFFSPDESGAIRQSLRNYVHYVVQEEWNLSQKKQIHSKARDTIKEIWNSYYNVNLNTTKKQIWYAESISKLNKFLNTRLQRQFNSWQKLGPLMWSLLLVGGVITICFMFFFGLENFKSHMLMTSLLAGYLTFMLLLIYSLDHAFSGPEKIKPAALEQVSSLFDQWDKSP